ncbi:MAG: chemotaxis protein CheW [Methylovulum sp.]|jgi:chemotaxis signal transduction protein|nr:chemotaxis protein CheW [Methylovulum sp.]
MNQYLQVATGPYQLLLNCAAVHEVLNVNHHDTAFIAGHLDIRNQTYEVLNSRAILDLEPILNTTHTGVIYTQNLNTAAFILLFDRVVGLQHVSAQQILPLPNVSKRLSCLFDGVFIDNKLDNKQLIYRLRYPLDDDVLFSSPKQNA